jgi:hypothetical protein
MRQAGDISKWGGNFSLPRSRGRNAESCVELEGLSGATIISFGAAPKGSDVEGGGLVVDYRRSGSEMVQRIVLAFNENGMWVEDQCYLPGPIA